MSNTSAIAQLQVQRELLRIEYQEEKEAYRLHTQNMGLARQVTRGDAWYPLSMGRTYYNSLNQYCIEVTSRERSPMWTGTAWSSPSLRATRWNCKTHNCH